MKIFRTSMFIALGWIATAPVHATVLYNLDFTPPETGTYQVNFGNPTVQSSVGPFTDALVFHAVTTYDQIQLNTTVAGATSYDVQCDVLVHNLLNSQYGFDVTLDTPEVRYVDFNGLNNNFYVFQPSAGATFGTFANDTVYHLDLAIDLANNRWTVSVNGTQRYASAFNATSLQDIRFDMSPSVGGATNAPTVYAALDNVLVTVVPEPGPAVWILGTALGAGITLGGRRFRRHV